MNAIRAVLVILGSMVLAGEALRLPNVHLDHDALWLPPLFERNYAQMLHDWPNTSNNIQLFMAGFSETRDLFDALAHMYTCSHHSGGKEDKCQRDIQWSVHQDAKWLAECREQLYSASPVKATCNGIASLWYEWKSFQWSTRDVAFIDNVKHAAQHGEPVIVLLGSGVHHFAKFPDFNSNLYHSVSDSHLWPQYWFDNYIAETLELFERVTKDLPTNVCILWTTNHIGTRVHGSTDAHHPSATNGLHHWLNRMTAALAKEKGIELVDLTNLTLAATSSLQEEGDLYHGYDFQKLAEEVMNQVNAKCVNT